MTVIRISFLLLAARPALAQIKPLNYAEIDKQTFTYTVKDSVELGLDVYIGKDRSAVGNKACIIFVFGGAFITGRRDDSIYNNYFNGLVSNNYAVVSITYRLGMKGVTKVSKYDIEPLKHALDMAVDDVYDATGWILANAAKFGIDTSKLILSGSSSGAVTVLEADFKKRNNKDAAKKQPEHFQYAGIVSFSGTVLSFDGKLKYDTPPAPTLLFHGTADKTVPYDQIRFLNKGLYGSSAIAETFKKNGYPYYIYRAVGLGHEMAVLPMIDHLPVILDFLDQFVTKNKPLQIDMSYKDPAIKPILIMTPQELFKKLQQRNAAATAAQK